MPFEAALTVKKCLFILIMSMFCILWIIGSILSDMDYLKAEASPLFTKFSSEPRPESSVKHLHWFMQVSDLHLSVFRDAKRGADFEMFCNQYVKTIKPEAVLVTGDLTDAKTFDMQGSQQYEEEWKEYNRVLKATKVAENTVWLDTRGNHDAFDVPYLDSQKNLYRKYSYQGQKHPRSYRYEHKAGDGDKFSFISVDACPDPGVRRPFNFFGILSQDDIDELHEYRKASEDSNMTIWFGHYPSTVITQPDPGLGQLLSSGAVYLCGHLHTLAGLAPAMYAAHRRGNLELELGDWKDNRRFRMFAVDHGLFSFVDEHLGVWPIVLVTNPKHAQFLMPRHEPVARIQNSTHIRILAFSPGSIESVRVEIDGEHVGDALPAEPNSPLYVLPWIPEMYTAGVHKLLVHVTDSLGNTRIVTQPFSLDQTVVSFSLLPRYILMTNHIALVKTAFVLLLVLCVAPLVLLRICRFRVQVAVTTTCVGCVARWIQKWLRRLYLLANTDKLFYSLTLFAIYVAVGPWMIGYALSDHLGIIFIHGIFVKNTWLPGTTTFVYGFFQLLTFNVPLTLYLARCLDLTIARHKDRDHPASQFPFLRWLADHGIFILLIVWQSYLAFFGFQRAYGTMAFLLCPVRTWSVGLALLLRRIAMTPRGGGHKPEEHVKNDSEDSGIGMSR